MTNNINNPNTEGESQTVVDQCNDIIEHVFSEASLTDKMKNKAKVRITAYQASILMDGMNTVLDDIDKLIIDASLNKNTNEISYKLTKQFMPYFEMLTENLKSRGFTVRSTAYDYYRMLYITWPIPN